MEVKGTITETQASREDGSFVLLVVCMCERCNGREVRSIHVGVRCKIYCNEIHATSLLTISTKL